MEQIHNTEKIKENIPNIWWSKDPKGFQSKTDKERSQSVTLIIRKYKKKIKILFFYRSPGKSQENVFPRVIMEIW